MMLLQEDIAHLPDCWQEILEHLEADHADDVLPEAPDSDDTGLFWHRADIRDAAGTSTYPGWVLIGHPNEDETAEPGQPYECLFQMDDGKWHALRCLPDEIWVLFGDEWTYCLKTPCPKDRFKHRQFRPATSDNR